MGPDRVAQGREPRAARRAVGREALVGEHRRDLPVEPGRRQVGRVGGKRDHEAARSVDAVEPGELGDLRGLGPGVPGGAVREPCDLVQAVGREVRLRAERRRRPDGRPGRLGLGAVGPLERVVLRGHGEPHELALELVEAGQVERAAQRHVRRVAVAAQHRDVRERRLDLPRDERRHRRDLLGHLVRHHDVVRPQRRHVEGPPQPSEVAVRPAHHDRLVLHRRVDRVARQRRHVPARLLDHRDLAGRHRAEAQALRDVQALGDVAEHPGHPLAAQVVPDVELDGPVVAVEVVHHRAEDEAAVLALVLGDQEEVVVGGRVDVPQDEVVVGDPPRRVHEVGEVAGLQVDDELDRLGPGDVEVARAARQPRPLVRCVDARRRLAALPQHARRPSLVRARSHR